MKKNEFKPHGYITINNTGGIEVKVNDSSDGVLYRFTVGDTSVEEAEIQYEPDEEGQAYFMVGETKYYLNQVMRYDR